MTRNVMYYHVMKEIWYYLDIKSLHNFVCAYPNHADSADRYIASPCFTKKILAYTNFVEMGEVEVKTRNDDLYLKVGRFIRLVQRSPNDGFDTYLSMLKNLEALLPNKGNIYQEELSRFCERIQTGLHHCANPEIFGNFVLERTDVNFVKNRLNEIKAAGFGTLALLERDLRRHVGRRVVTGREDVVVPSMLLKRLGADDRAYLVRLLYYAMTSDDTVDWNCLSSNIVSNHAYELRSLALFVKKLWKHAGMSEECLDKVELLHLVKSVVGRGSATQSPWSRVAVHEFLRTGPSRDLAKEMIIKDEFASLARLLEILFTGDRNHPFHFLYVTDLVAFATDAQKPEFLVFCFREYLLYQHGNQQDNLMQILENNIGHGEVRDLINQMFDRAWPELPNEPRPAPNHAHEEPRPAPNQAHEEPRPGPSRDNNEVPAKKPRRGPPTP